MSDTITAGQLFAAILFRINLARSLENELNRVARISRNKRNLGIFAPVWGECSAPVARLHCIKQTCDGARRAWTDKLAGEDQLTAGTDDFREWVLVHWRRIFGAAFMTLGAAAIVAMAALASVVIVNYVEWENAPDALGTVAMVTLPPALAGAAILALGRLVYGEWEDRSPVLNASAAAIRIAGFVVAIGLGAMLLFLAATGITADDQIAAAALAVGTTAGIVLIVLGFRIRSGSGRRYLD